MGVKLDAQFESSTTKRILTLDIETRPNVGWIWDLRVQGGYISPAMLIEHGSIMCWAAKWLGVKKVEFASDHHDGHEQQVKKLWDMLDEADIVIGYNSDKFDLRHIRREFLLSGLPPTSPFKSVDLIKTARSKFAFASNSLNHVSGRLGIGEKVKHEGFGLWLACMDGDEAAWKRMARYNKQDVRLTEDLYLELLPWITGHPHVTVSGKDELRCTRCGSLDLERTGETTAVVHTYALYRCTNCAGQVRATHLKRIAGTTAV